MFCFNSGQRATIRNISFDVKMMSQVQGGNCKQPGASPQTDLCTISKPCLWENIVKDIKTFIIDYE